MAAPRLIDTETASCAVCGGERSRLLGVARDFEYATCDNDFRYVACEACGHVYLENRPVRSALSTIYPPEYGNYDGERSRALTFRVKAALDERRLSSLFAGVPRVNSVLDIGCADGRTLDLCRRLLPSAELHGVEISRAAAENALRKGYAVTLGTIDELELPEARYDVILLQQVIEHVFDPALVCRKIRSALRPDGIVIFETPTTDCLDFRLFRRRYWGGYHVPRHFNLFSERTLSRLCRDAGLDPISARYTPQPIHWVWTLRHALSDRGAPGVAYRGLGLRNPVALACGTVVELAARAATGRMSNLVLVARRGAA